MSAVVIDYQQFVTCILLYEHLATPKQCARTKLLPISVAIVTSSPFRVFSSLLLHHTLLSVTEMSNLQICWNWIVKGELHMQCLSHYWGMNRGCKGLIKMHGKDFNINHICTKVSEGTLQQFKYDRITE